MLYIVEKIQNKVFKSAKEGTLFVANQIKNLIEEKAKSGEFAVLGLATGASPISLYKELVKMHKNGLSFSNVITFNLDEYYPMEPQAIQSYHRFMEEHLFSKVDIPSENINIPKGTLSMDEIQSYCKDYEKKIDDLGGIDIQILGIGRTGHIGFNEPGSTSRSYTRLVTLDKKTRRDASKDFKSIESVPRKAITMGVGTIFKAKSIYLMAWGEKKAKIVSKAIESRVSSLIPATFLQNHPEAIMVIDEPAATDLKRVKTPWLVGDCEWTEQLTLKAVCWLSEKLNKAVLKLTDEDYNEYGMGDLIAQMGSAYELNLNIFRHLRDTITGWPGGKPDTGGQRRPERTHPFPKRSLVLSPHPDDDVISMGGTFIRLIDQGHEVSVGYMTNGSMAVHDEDVVNRLSFMRHFMKTFELKEDKIEEFSVKIKSFFQSKDSSTIDLPEVVEIKSLIRKREAQSAYRFCGVDDDNAYFLDLPFYKTGKAQKNPISDEDIKRVKELILEIKPHQIFVAGDKADPHGTHQKCLEIFRSAFQELIDENQKWVEDCWIWQYRGAWLEWPIDEIEMAVPLSPDEVAKKRSAIFKHESQKNGGVFPGDDARAFWERAEDRNRKTAELYNQLGLPEYQAAEAFKRLRF
ncbi:MAG: glucosamine-6-phosphate deaminase [Flavobacteriales bacterium]|nr:glucosamine-6-phosphate deaminase [Flavobacteriales bacterium]